MTGPSRSAKLGSSGYRLKNGDVLRIGDYQIVVALETRDGTRTIPELDAAAAVPTSIHALHPIGRAAQTDIGAMLDLEELLVATRVARAALQPVNAYGQAIAPPACESRRRGRRLRPIRARNPSPAASRGSPRRPAGTRAGASAPALYDVQSGLQAFCRGAGIDPEKLPADAQTRLLHLTGQLLREALVGLKDLERSRSEIRDRFRIELPPPEPDDPRPSLGRA